MSGLDVETSDLVAARERFEVLGSALDAATRRQVEGQLTDAQFDAVARADRDMVQAVAQLDDGERSEFVPTAHQVHLRAVALFVAEGRDLAPSRPRDRAGPRSRRDRRRLVALPGPHPRVVRS